MTAGVVETGTVLDRILARTVADLATRRATTPLTDLERGIAARPAPVSLRDALLRNPPAVIAEIKRASPSRGVFPVAVDPATVAGEYLAGGAAALSILTDNPFFHGSLADLAAGAAVAHDRARPAPVLRKDFVLDAYQIAEARAFGADAVLLIAAALDDATLAGLLSAAAGYGLDALVEVHDEAEMARAAAAGATLIGINNRDLRTFAVDLATTERVAPLAPEGALLVGESGIFDGADVARLVAVGVGAVLVGESLILAGDRAAAVRALRGVAR
ncbi:MAG: Indole-3-glycerol phosphate synthase [uncultured Thermomicrobiales bacterium]|uniref:Indole-3-glycerol phosphate synthase n=1 Tax=uncultured Thermomicrobiales bacterium TaxID=1645740 RepID=A0A6J4U0E4_9BACT|nr:MAG: Indole-3-glycerol phosphate synthase [uncultured Thermomicrobiales bacterium]